MSDQSRTRVWGSFRGRAIYKTKGPPHSRGLPVPGSGTDLAWRHYMVENSCGRIARLEEDSDGKPTEDRYGLGRGGGNDRRQYDVAELCCPMCWRHGKD